MSTLSELLPAGGGGATVDFVASGTLPNGKPVVLKADGTVEVVGETAITESIPEGSAAILQTGDSRYHSVAFDPNTASKFVVSYRDAGNSGYGTAIVGTVSGTSISFGSEYVFNSASIYFTSVAFDSNTASKLVIAYRDGGNANNGTAIVGTISGTTLSFGTAVVYNTGTSDYPSVSFDPNTAGKFVVAYRDGGNSNSGTAIVGTVSGTSISFGTEVVFNSASTQDGSLSFDPNTAGKFVIAYYDGGSTIGEAVVGTVSGTTLSFGTAVVFNSGISNKTSAAFDPNTAGKFVVAYQDGGNSYYGTATVGTVSGTSITFGAEYVYNSANSDYGSLSFDPNSSGKFVVAYLDNGNSSYGTAIVGTVSGTTISFGSEYVFNAGPTYHISAAFDPNTAGKFVVAYQADGATIYGKASLGQMATATTNLTTSNFVGTSTEAYTNAETATIAVQGGLSTNQTGLTIGSTYYVQPAGTLATTAGSPSVTAGKALSTTTLLLKDL